MTLRILICLAFILAFSNHLNAQLICSKSEVKTDCKINDSIAIASFHFANNGDYPIKIQNVVTGCGCITTAIPQSIFKPGVEGDLTVSIRLNNEFGPFQKSIVVLSDDPKSPSQVLKVDVNLPLIFELSQQRMEWNHGDKTDPQSSIIRISDPSHVHILGVKYDSHKLTVSLKSINKEGKCEVTVSPNETNTPVATHVILETDIIVDGKPKLLTLAVIVNE